MYTAQKNTADIRLVGICMACTIVSGNSIIISHLNYYKGENIWNCFYTL